MRFPCHIFGNRERERNVLFNDALNTFYLRLYGVRDIWLRTILIVKKETRFRHIGYSYRLTARVLLYAISHRQDNTYHCLCYTSRGALAGARNIWKQSTLTSVLTSTMSLTCLLMVSASGGLTPATQSANTTGFVGVVGCNTTHKTSTYYKLLFRNSKHSTKNIISSIYLNQSINSIQLNLPMKPINQTEQKRKKRNILFL